MKQIRAADPSDGVQTRTADSLDDVLRDERLTPLFQPVVSGDGRTVFGYEALIRGPENSPLHSPLALFSTAGRVGRLVELDFLCRRLSIQAFAELGLPGYLFLNVMPESLIKRDFREGLTSEFLKSVGLAVDRVVIELTEHSPVHDYNLLGRALAHYRGMGFKVALDDLGGGYSSLRHWAELRPDFIKIDRHFIKGIDYSPGKRQFVQSILEVASKLGCEVVAEGLETAGEFHALASLNCLYFQGYFFARPTDKPATVMDRVLTPPTSHRTEQSGVAADICTFVAPAGSDASFADITERFRAEPQLRCIPIVEDGKPLGVVRQHEFLKMIAGPFAHALYAKRKALESFNSEMIVVQATTPLESLSQIVTETKEGLQQDFVIVDDQYGYQGMGNIVDLLRAITAIQIRTARQSNPLTGLPGNLVIDDTLNRSIASGQPFAAVYCDLDNFKSYNDVYGYARGDDILVALGRLLQQHCSHAGEFVGHVGGDDFVLILQPDGASATCEAILEDFERIAPGFYSEEDRGRGGLFCESRSGQQVFCPIVSLSLALQQVTPESHRNSLDVANSLSELKKQAKRIAGNSVFMDRRKN